MALELSDEERERLRQWSVSIQTQMEMDEFEDMTQLHSPLSIKRRRGDSNLGVGYANLLEAQERDRTYFKGHFQELRKKFPGEYVAIHEQVVVDSDKDLTRLLGRIRSGQDRNKRFYIEKVDETFWINQGGPDIIIQN